MKGRAAGAQLTSQLILVGAVQTTALLDQRPELARRPGAPRHPLARADLQLPRRIQHEELAGIRQQRLFIGQPRAIQAAGQG